MWAQEPAAPVSAPTTADTSAASATTADSAAPSTTIIPPPPTASELSAARKQFNAGSKLLSSGKTEEAFEKFKLASELSPRSVDYATAREFTRQQLVMDALERGNKAMLADNEVLAAAEFRRALEFDPDNQFARQRLKDAVWEETPAPSRSLQVAQTSVEVSVSPDPGSHDFHYKGDSRGLLTDIARAYGITATIDDSVRMRPVRFDIDHVTFAQAMEAATAVTKSFWLPLSGSQIYVVADTTENRKNFERLVLRTFYFSDISVPQELSEIVNALRVILDIRLVSADTSKSTITVRAPQAAVDAASKLVESIAGGRPQVVLEVRVYQVSSSLVRQMGLQLPNQFTMFNISPALAASLLGGSGQNLINQLIASGGINQANSQAIQALLSQLQSAAQNPLLSTPFATFGGGLTLMGVNGTPPITANLQVNESDVKALEHVELLASQNTPALMRIGERYPIVNATFAPIYNSAAISQVLGNQSYTAPFPSFNFEDLGLNLKATPLIHSNADVSLKIELNIRTLGGQAVNGIPIILNREYTGSITLKNEESGVVAGILSKSDSQSLAGYPFLSRVPGLTYAASNHTKNVNDDELLVVMTPHIIRMANPEGFAVQLPAGH